MGHALLQGDKPREAQNYYWVWDRNFDSYASGEFFRGGDLARSIVHLLESLSAPHGRRAAGAS